MIDVVRAKLLARKGEWKQIAKQIPGVSYSWISQVARGKYKSSPTYDRMQAVLDYLDGRSSAGS